MAERKTISFPLWVLLNYLAWLIFWLFIQPVGLFEVAKHKFKMMQE